MFSLSSPSRSFYYPEPEQRSQRDSERQSTAANMGASYASERPRVETGPTQSIAPWDRAIAYLTEAYRLSTTQPDLRPLLLLYNQKENEGSTIPVFTAQTITQQPIDVQVLEFYQTPAIQNFKSAEEFRKYLAGSGHVPRLFMVNGLNFATMGLLGSFFGLRISFFLNCLDNNNPPLHMRLPSRIKTDHSLHLQFNRYTTEGIKTEKISLYLSSHGRLNGICFINDYSLSKQTMDSLDAHLTWNSIQENKDTTLRQSMIRSLLDSQHEQDLKAGSLPATIHAILPVLLSEWEVLLSTIDTEVEQTQEAITTFASNYAITNEQFESLAWFTEGGEKWDLSGCRKVNRQLHEITRFFSYEFESQSSSNALLMDIRLMNEDVEYLQSYASQIEESMDWLNKRRLGCYSYLKRIGKESGSINGQGQQRGNQQAVSTNPLTESFEPFALHMQRKIDQIAYMTNILLSLSFTVGLYGMNLDIFVDGGLVGLKKYLSTAIPFAVGIFAVTFVLPVYIRWPVGKKPKEVTVV